MTFGRIGILLTAYLVGSVPTGYWLGLAWKGIDVRQHGSGNLGATNVFRVLGKGPGLLTLGIDIFKGLAPVLIVQHVYPDDVSMALSTGLFAILGHTLSVFVRFRGGKGVATSAGVFAALLPGPSVVGLFVFAVVFGLTRYVSLGSISGALTLAASAFAFAAPRSLAWAAVGVATFVVWTHRTNIGRLLNGTEHKI